MRPAVEFFLGPFGCGKDLRDISAMDFAKSAERDVDAFCRQGFGTLLTKLARRAADANCRRRSRRSTRRASGGVDIVTAKGRCSARAVIVTASTNVLMSGKIKFTPDLPKRQLDACDKLSLGSYDRIVAGIAGQSARPAARRSDVRESRAASAPRRLLANVGGSTLAFVDVGGKFGRDLAAQGPGAR